MQMHFAKLDSGYRRLAGAVIAFAVTDMRSTVPLVRAAARQWLLTSTDAEFWCRVADVNLRAIRTAILQMGDERPRKRVVYVKQAHRRHEEPAESCTT